MTEEQMRKAIEGKPPFATHNPDGPAACEDFFEVEGGYISHCFGGNDTSGLSDRELKASVTGVIDKISMVKTLPKDVILTRED